MNRDFKGIWIPREIWLTKGLKPAYRVFLAEIWSLDRGRGCWADNDHFAELFGLSKNRCSEIIHMLQKKGLVSVSFSPKNKYGRVERTIHVLPQKSMGLTPSENRQTPSENRQTPSENRQTPSENRQPIYKDEKYKEKYKERETRAFEFLFKNCEAKLEQQFLMKYKSQILDFEKFVQDFNDKVDIEQLAYVDTVLMARICSYARNWIANQKNKKDKDQVSTSLPKTFRTAI